MTNEPVQFFNRYSERIETETIYGESWLRWCYGNPLGTLALNALVKRAAFSRWYGWRMDGARSRGMIQPFIERYEIRTEEFEDSVDSFKTFNEFFYRRLKREARPSHPAPGAIHFPADGRHLGFQNLSMNQGFYVKGQSLNLAELLQDARVASEYAEGTLVISRLCPVDYHRFHFPVSGKASNPRLIEGPLFSVNPIALRKKLRILSLNRRWITTIDVPGRGRVLMIEVGATNVGSAISTFSPAMPVQAGDEKGYFRFGGSMTLCLFPKGAVVLDRDLSRESATARELYAKVGDRMGRWT